MLSFDQVLNEIGENHVYSKLIISEIIDHLIFQIYTNNPNFEIYSFVIQNSHPYIRPNIIKNSKEKEICLAFMNILLKFGYCEFKGYPELYEIYFLFSPEQVFRLRREWNAFNLPEYTEEQRADKAAYYLTMRK